jgi:hypothetical protein
LITVETTPGLVVVVGQIKENDGGSEFKYDIFKIL